MKMHSASDNLQTTANFTLIEIVLALALIFVGMTVVMGLFPLGLISNFKAGGQVKAAAVGQLFLDVVSDEVKDDWSWTDAIPNAKFEGDDLAAIWSDDLILDNDNVTIAFATDDADDTFDPSIHQSGVFRVQQLTNGQVDFSGIVRCSKTVVENVTDANTGAVALHAEVSWPAEQPYETRDKEVFSIEFFKQAMIEFEPTVDPCAAANTDSLNFATEITRVSGTDCRQVTFKVYSTATSPLLSSFHVSAVM